MMLTGIVGQGDTITDREVTSGMPATETTGTRATEKGSLVQDRWRWRTVERTATTSPPPCPYRNDHHTGHYKRKYLFPVHIEWFETSSHHPPLHAFPTRLLSS